MKWFQVLKDKSNELFGTQLTAESTEAETEHALNQVQATQEAQATSESESTEATATTEQANETEQAEQPNYATVEQLNALRDEHNETMQGVAEVAMQGLESLNTQLTEAIAELRELQKQSKVETQSAVKNLATAVNKIKTQPSASSEKKPEKFEIKDESTSDANGIKKDSAGNVEITVPKAAKILLG